MSSFLSAILPLDPSKRSQRRASSVSCPLLLEVSPSSLVLQDELDPRGTLQCHARILCPSTLVGALAFGRPSPSFRAMRQSWTTWRDGLARSDPYVGATGSLSASASSKRGSRPLPLSFVLPREFCHLKSPRLPPHGWRPVETEFLNNYHVSRRAAGSNRQERKREEERGDKERASERLFRAIRNKVPRSIGNGSVVRRTAWARDGGVETALN